MNDSTPLYVHHAVSCAPRAWSAVARQLGATDWAAHGGALYGLWRAQIGRPRDELTVITTWAIGTDPTAADRLIGSLATLRPTDTVPPTRQGNYAFRWFAVPEPNWREFLDLCAAAWPGFEGAYDSQVIGLWQATGDRTGKGADEVTGAGRHDGVRSLLLTRRPNLAMWERSKLPEGAAEAAVRDKLSRRYDLCDWTVVSTATLLTAVDRADTARWT